MGLISYRRRKEAIIDAVSEGGVMISTDITGLSSPQSAAVLAPGVHWSPTSFPHSSQVHWSPTSFPHSSQVHWSPTSFPHSSQVAASMRLPRLQWAPGSHGRDSGLDPKALSATAALRWEMGSPTPQDTGAVDLDA